MLSEQGSIGEDGIVIMTSPSGQISGKTIANINPDKNSEDDGGFLAVLLSPLPGDSQQEKMIALGAIGGILFLMFVAVIVVLRRSQRGKMNSRFRPKKETWNYSLKPRKMMDHWSQLTAMANLS